jgi:hypothetical protein
MNCWLSLLPGIELRAHPDQKVFKGCTLIKQSANTERGDETREAESISYHADEDSCG